MTDLQPSKCKKPRILHMLRAVGGTDVERLIQRVENIPIDNVEISTDEEGQIEGIIKEISQLITGLIIPNQEGRVDETRLGKITLHLSKVLTYLLEISVATEEMSSDSHNQLSEEFVIILREMLLK
jgi:hypothetical protein